jgi:hypothetical protein
MDEAIERSEHTNASGKPHVLAYATPAKPERGRSLAWAGVGCCVVAIGVVIVMPWRASVGLAAVFAGLPIAGLLFGIAAEHRAIDETGTVRRTARIAITFACIEFSLLALAVPMLPSNGRPRESANRVKCGSNLRQIGQAITLYAQANRGQFPPDLPALVLGEITPEVLVCVSSSAEPASAPTTAAVVQQLRTEAGHCSYVYAGVGLTSATATAAHVIAYDFGENHQKQGINVLHGDGAVELISQREAAYLLSELNAGHNPQRVKPSPGK